MDSIDPILGKVLNDDHLQLGQFYTNHMFAWADTTETDIIFLPTNRPCCIDMYVCMLQSECPRTITNALHHEHRNIVVYHYHNMHAAG